MQIRKEKYQKTTSTSIVQQFSVFAIKKELIAQFKISSISGLLIYLILLGKQMEILGLWLYSYKDNTTFNKNNMLEHIINLQLSISQPYNEAITQKTLSIITLLIIIIQIFYYIGEFSIYYKQKKKKQISLLKYFEKQGEFHKFLCYMIYYYNNSFNQIMIIPFLDINFSLLIDEIQEEQNLVYIFITIINLIFILFHSILCELFISESLSIQRKNFENLRYTFNNLIQYLLLILMIIIKCLPIDLSTKYLLLSVIVILNNLLEILNIFQVLQQTNLAYFKLIMYSYILLWIIQLLFLDNIEYNIGYFLLPPLFSIILFKQFSYQESRYIYSSYKLSPEKIQYLLSINLNEIKQQQQGNQFIKLNQYIYLRTHNLSCYDSKCFCKKKNKQEIKKEYLKQLCIQFSEIFLQVKEESLKFLFYMHFLSTMNLLGLNTQALKQSINIEFDSHSIFSIQSMKKQQPSSSSNISGREKEKIPIDQKKLNFKTLNSIQQLKFDVLKEFLQSGLNFNFKKTENINQESFSLNVKMFFEQEEKQRQQIQEIQKIINHKREFLIEIMSKVELNSKKLFIKSKQIVQELQDFFETINAQYQQFPSQKLQSILSFFVGEIQGNYQKCHRISTINKINDEQLLQLQNQMAINLFSNRINYLNCSLENDLRLKIKQRSPYCYKFFEYKKEEFELIQTLDKLLPYGFTSIHRNLVSQFLENGSSKFFRTSNFNYGLSKHKYLKQFQFSYDINQQSQQKLELIAFIEDYDIINDNIIIVGPNNKIGGVTKGLLRSVRYSNQTINLIDPLKLLYKHTINCLLPDMHSQSTIYKTLIYQDKSINEQTIFTQKFHFLKEDYVLDTIDKYGQNYDWSNPENLDFYTASIKSKKVEIYETSYQLIQLSNIKMGTQSVIQTRYSPTKSSFKNDFNVTSLEISSEDVRQLPNAIFSEQEKDLFQFRPSIQEKSVGKKVDALPKQMTQNLDFTGIQQEKLEVSYYTPYMQQQQILFSPKESFSGMLDNKQKNKQQLFFQASLKDVSESNQKEASSDDQINLAQELFQLEADEEFRKNVLEQFAQKKQQNAVDVDDVGSQVSSLIGFKKSKYFKKYELYDCYQESPIFPKSFKIMMFFYLLAISLGLIFSLITIINSDIDLTRFLEEIDMLSIQGYLMGPLYKFINIQYSYTGYRLSIDFLGYPQNRMYQWLSLTAMEANLTYNELKLNFQTQMINPYLQQFFNDIYIDVKFQSGLYELETRNITFRESLSLIVENGYIFSLTNVTSPNPVGNKPHITYYGANIFVFPNYFDELTINIQDYTNERTYQVAAKQLAISIPLIYLYILIKMISYCYYRQYLRNYDHACQLFDHLKPNSTQNEILRLKVISELIYKDPSTVYRYQFDIDLKDAYILSQQNRDQQKEIINLKHKNQNSNKFQQISLTLIPSILCFILLASVFLIYSQLIVVFVQRFLDSYRPSIDFFRGLSDVSISINGIYAFREFSYYTLFKTFYYYNETTIPLFLERFEKDKQKVIQFQQSLQTFDASNILTSDQFDYYLNEYKTKDLCSFINITQYQQYYNPYLPPPIINNYCDTIYEGVMLLGLQPTLIEAVNRLESEKQINGFTVRQGFGIQELELPMITSQILLQLLEYYKNNLVDVTSQLINEVQILSSLVIVYLGLQALLLVTTVLNYMKEEFLLSKRFLQLLPQNLLFVDSQFERSLRTYIAQQQLI